MRHKHYMKGSFIYFLLVLFFIPGCQDDPAPANELRQPNDLAKKTNDSLLLDIKKTIQTGDLLLRTGTDFSSDQIKDLCKTDKTYSHGGIAVSGNDSIYIYSIEPDYYNINNTVRKESIDSFCNAAKNDGIGIARYNLSDNEKKGFIAYLEEQYQKKISFDMLFSLETDNKMYCSEMIKKGLARATNNRVVIKTDKLDDRSKYRIIKRYFKVDEKRFANMQVVMVDQLFLNPNCQFIKKYLFTGR